MRRCLNAFAVLCLILWAVTALLWVLSFIRDLHVGSAEIEVDRYGLVVEHRSGMFSADGRFCVAAGQVVRFEYEEPGAMVPPASRRHWTVASGSFDPWCGRFAADRKLGFGTFFLGQPHMLIGVSVPYAWLVLIWAVLPGFRWVAQRRSWPRAQFATAVLATYVALVLFGITAVSAPTLGALIFLYACIVLVWAAGRYGSRAWQDRRDRARRGRCRVCGYDLRATPDPDGPLLNRCPECGTYAKPLAMWFDA